MTPNPVELSRLMAEDAVGYFMAARKVTTGEDFYGIMTFYRMPLNFLLGQCCELALKSLLLTKGWSRQQLIEIGHDLVSLATTAKAEGVALDPEFLAYCDIMGDAHKKLDFRYSGRACPPFIGPEDALKMIEPQLRAIAPFGMPGTKR